ncbi:hypothetical protein CEXT_340931 [Caerostris extrusa]|uniref:Uncharacterized protein n=1 Tax=Caerostris extrusa TaxID=172846 RepID=A0AAV4Q4T9_CAEEX|nr:hypothetical protein CEXT_340931 [Caerostris extrusa]
MDSSNIIEIIEVSLAFCVIHPCFIYQKGTRRRHDRKCKIVSVAYYSALISKTKTEFSVLLYNGNRQILATVLMPNGRKISVNIPHSNLITSI